jgi:hydroxymethylglutaryl-CoA synthase
MFKNVGIVGYGAYIPKRRIMVADIARAWHKKPEEILRVLGIIQKSVAAGDEDSVTMAIMAATNALIRAKLPPSKIEAVFVGSESHPYVVNPTATSVGEILGIGNYYFASDTEFACKAGTAGMIMTAGLLEGRQINYGLVIGADRAQARPHDVLEYTASSGAAAFVLGNKKEEFLARILDFTSFSSDTPDFWRRDGICYPSHGGRFTGEPAYFTHVLGAAEQLLYKSKMKPSDFDFVVFHMPNGKFPREAAKRLGFNEKQTETGLIVPHIGNPYSASSLLGLSFVLDKARPDQRIFLVSYGSGAGSDAFIIEISSLLAKRRRLAPVGSFYLRHKENIDYSTYLRMQI